MSSSIQAEWLLNNRTNMLICLFVPGFVGPNALYLLSNGPWIACYSMKQCLLGYRLWANPTQVVPFDKFKVGSLLTWNKGCDEKRLLQHECFRDKARSRFTGYDIC